MIQLLKLFIKTFPNFNLVTFITAIEANLDDCESVLDVGCGDNSPLRLLNNRFSLVGVDGYKKAIDSSKKRGIHKKYIYCDVKDLLNKVKQKSFDAVVALDLIEHLTKDDGYKFLKDIEKIAKKKLIIVTPNGFIVQLSKSNQLQQHLSGWTTEDFRKRGFKVKGLYGLKLILLPFRSDYAECKFKPKWFWGFIWGLVSEVTHHFFTKNRPELSFSLLAVKKIN